MSGRFLSPKDLVAAQHQQEVINSMIKRGEIDTSNVVRERHVVCGCGAEGCVFISMQKENKDETQNSN